MGAVFHVPDVHVVVGCAIVAEAGDGGEGDRRGEREGDKIDA